MPPVNLCGGRLFSIASGLVLLNLEGILKYADSGLHAVAVVLKDFRLFFHAVDFLLEDFLHPPLGRGHIGEDPAVSVQLV